MAFFIKVYTDRYIDLYLLVRRKMIFLNEESCSQTDLPFDITRKIGKVHTFFEFF